MSSNDVCGFHLHDESFCTRDRFHDGPHADHSVVEQSTDLWALEVQLARVLHSVSARIDAEGLPSRTALWAAAHGISSVLRTVNPRHDNQEFLERVAGV